MAKLYNFKLELAGWGENPEEAWDACKENFDIDREELPKSTVEEEMEDEED